MNIDTESLSVEARQALRTFGVAAARYHAAKKQKVKIHFRFTEHVQEVFVPRSIETDYIDAKVTLRSFDELKELTDSIDSGARLDALEAIRFTKEAEKAYADSYAEMVAIEKEIAAFASTL